MKLSFAVLLILLTSVAVSAKNQRRPVQVLSVDYPPYTSPRSPNLGISYYHLNKFAKDKLAVRYEPYFVPPGRAEAVIKSGNWCMSFYPPGNRAANTKFIPLSEQVIRLGLIRKKKSQPFQWQSLTEFKGKRVAMLRSSLNGELQALVGKGGAVLVYVESLQQGLKMLHKGRVDYAFGDDLTLTTMQIDGVDLSEFQFSDTSIKETQPGFFYNMECPVDIFKP